jgi:hypothetical protein
MTSRPVRGTRRGRPRKFDRPASSVTLTLPEEVIENLKAIDRDLSRAIVRVVQRLGSRASESFSQVTTFGDRSTVILVPHDSSLGEQTGLDLLPVADGRAMLCVDGQISIADLELRLADASNDPELPAKDRDTFEELIEILRSARREEGVVLKKRRLVLLRANRPELS